MAQLVKNLLAMQEMQVQSLGGEDHFEKEMATHSSILAWEIPWTEELARLQSIGLQESDAIKPPPPPQILWYSYLEEVWSFRVLFLIIH